MKVEDRFEKLEEKVKLVVETTDALTELRIKTRERDSVREMEGKVEDAMNCVKVMNIDIGRQTEDKKEIIRKALDVVRSYVQDEDLRWYDTVIRRTRLIVLGKSTKRWDRDGISEYSVPILFECRDRRDADSLDSALRGAGYFPTFHWPTEILDFITGVKDEVKKGGVSDTTHFFKVRPEKRDGRMQVKVEVKPKAGGRFVLKGVWMCPPVHRHLWDSVEGLYRSRLETRP